MKNINLLNQRIKTKRLFLEPISLDYVEDIFKEFTKEITTYMHPQPAKNIRETKNFIIDSLKGLENGSNFQLIILDKNSREFLGCAGIHNLYTKPEFGIWLKKTAHGKKYGQETIIALKKWADKNLDYKFIIYPVGVKNIPSRKIPELLGGKIFRKYSDKNFVGKKLNFIEYRIYKI